MPGHRQVLRHCGGPRDPILGSDNGEYFLRAHRTIHSRRTYFATVKKIDVHTFIAPASSITSFSRATGLAAFFRQKLWSFLGDWLAERKAYFIIESMS
jgi:hypothetical protein